MKKRLRSWPDRRDRARPELTGARRAAGEYYGGKTIRFISAFRRRRLRRVYPHRGALHQPPYRRPSSTVVENMDGAGSVITANHIYDKASHDGLTVSVFNAHNIFNHMMGDRSTRLNSRKFGWIGTPGKDSVACAIMAFTVSKLSTTSSSQTAGAHGRDQERQHGPSA